MQEFSSVKAIIFDMDGLLIDSEPLWRKAEIKSFEEVGVYLTEDDCRETMGYRLNEVVELWYGRRPWQGRSLREMENRILELVKQYILKEGKPMPGVKVFIEACLENKLKIAVASSSAMVLIEAVVKILGMEGRFDVLHSAQYEVLGKPHPAVFISTAMKLGLEPHECLVLEDSFHGMVAALAAKMPVIVIPGKEMLHDKRFNAAHLTLSSLEGADIKVLLNL